MSSDYQVALEEFIEELKSLTLFEIYTKLKSKNIIPLYASHKQAYYPVALSKRKILRWFQYQFTDWLDVIKIIINMTNSLRHRTKQNTLLLFGPKDSGKTFVLQSFCTFAILSSNLRDFSKQFGKQHAINQRLLFLDEPKDMGKDIEEVKLLCGGQESLVDIKFRSPRELRYPPVFIASNDDIFEIDPDGIFITKVISLTTEASIFGTNGQLKIVWPTLDNFLVHLEIELIPDEFINADYVSSSSSSERYFINKKRNKKGENLYKKCLEKSINTKLL